MSQDTIEVFISYSKQDKELRDGLLNHLHPLAEQGIVTWYDRQILPGTEWDDEIKARLNAADIILLLLSADFLATDYCRQVEIPEALRRHEAGEAIVMPVILRHCGWEFTPLAKIQAYPEKAKPIRSWLDIDEAYLNVVREVYIAATEIKKQRQQRQAAELERSRQAEQLKQKQAAEAERLRQEESARQKQSIASDDLSSERNINYTRLRDLLKAGKWKEADKETADRMLEIMGQQEEGWLRPENIEQFPCTDLRTIDQLWVKYSNGKFGFSVQKQIWQECGSPTEYNAKWGKFGDRVGWRKGILKKEWIAYSEVTFSTSALEGHLPVLPGWGELALRFAWWVYSSLAHRLVKCSMK